MAKKNWCVKFNLMVTAEEYVYADTEEEAMAIVEKARMGSNLAKHLEWQFHRDIDESREFDGFDDAEVTLIECRYIDDEPINDYIDE